MKSIENVVLRRFNVSFYPSSEIDREIMAANETLKSYLADDYVLAIAHLTLYYAAIPLHNLKKLKQAVEEYARTMERVEVVIGEVVAKEDGYIMLDVRNKDELATINRNLMNLIAPLREGQIMQKYKDNWNTYSEERKRTILETGHQYPYESHLTLAKVREDTIEEAMAKAKGLNLEGASFKPDSIHLGISEDEAVVRTGLEDQEYKIGKTSD